MTFFFSAFVAKIPWEQRLCLLLAIPTVGCNFKLLPGLQAHPRLCYLICNGAPGGTRHCERCILASWVCCGSLSGSGGGSSVLCSLLPSLEVAAEPSAGGAPLADFPMPAVVVHSCWSIASRKQVQVAAREQWRNGNRDGLRATCNPASPSQKVLPMSYFNLVSSFVCSCALKLPREAELSRHH